MYVISRKWYRWTQLQSRNSDTDVENELVDKEQEEKGGMNWESRTDIYTLPCVYTELSSVLCDDLEEWDDRSRREVIYVYL